MIDVYSKGVAQQTKMFKEPRLNPPTLISSSGSRVSGETNHRFGTIKVQGVGENAGLGSGKVQEKGEKSKHQLGTKEELKNLIPNAYQQQKMIIKVCPIYDSLT